METETNPSASVALFRQATDVAGVCKEIVVRTACEIDGRRFVRCEGWSAIAVAHGCIATIRSVIEDDKGVKAIAEIRRQSDGAVLTTAEGSVGKDEPVWYGGKMMRWDKIKRCKVEADMPKRADYAIRAMAQTRAISRACRTAFSHVVVLMKEGLETTPAEEVIDAETEIVENHGQKGEGASHPDLETKAPTKEMFIGGKWKEVTIHFGTSYKGKKLGELSKPQLDGWLKWQPKEYQGKISFDDQALRVALDVAAIETAE